MEKIISYDELPDSNGQSIYLKMETDPNLYLNLLFKGYKLVKNIMDADSSTIYVTGRREDNQCLNSKEYKETINNQIQNTLSKNNIVKPNTSNFSLEDLFEHKYSLPFVFKNENQNGGKEKFLIQTEEDYENLILACKFLLNRDLLRILSSNNDDIRYKLNYHDYLTQNFSIQDYISTPTDYNTTVRLLTSSSNDLLYSVLKYKKPELHMDKTSLLGFLLYDVYPIGTKSIVSNTLSGGKNILLGEGKYLEFEKRLLDQHGINSYKFQELITASKNVHESFKSELGIICGFDYIYDKEKEKWFLLEYHSRPMLGDYSKRQGISYETQEDRLVAEGRVRATALSLVLKKTR